MSTKKKCALPKSVFPEKFKTTSAVHALQLAKQLITPYKHWTIGEFAIDKEGVEVEYDSRNAQAFCAMGAISRVNGKFEDKATEFLVTAAWLMDNGKTAGKPNPEYLKAFLEGYEAGEGEIDKGDTDLVFHVNDEGQNRETHKEVLKMFDIAIGLAQLEQKNEQRKSKG